MSRVIVMFGMAFGLLASCLGQIPDTITLPIPFAEKTPANTKVSIEFYYNKTGGSAINKKPVETTVAEPTPGKQVAFDLKPVKEDLKPLADATGFYVMILIPNQTVKDRLAMKLRQTGFDLGSPPGPVDSDKVRIYTQLAAGFGHTNDAARTFYSENTGTTQAPTYEMRSSRSASTVSTALTGLVSIAIKTSVTGWFNRAMRNTFAVEAFGFTFGTGIQSSTAGSVDIAPFSGFSFFFGENNSVALTIGWQWIPRNNFKNFNTTTGQFDSFKTYGKGTTFVGVTYRIAGSG